MKVLTEGTDRLRELCDDCAFSIERKKARLIDKLNGEEGLGTIEVVLIIVVLIALVVIFKDKIKTVLNNIMKQITSSSTSVWS